MTEIKYKSLMSTSGMEADLKSGMKGQTDSKEEQQEEEMRLWGSLGKGAKNRAVCSFWEQ